MDPRSKSTTVSQVPGKATAQVSAMGVRFDSGAGGGRANPGVGRDEDDQIKRRAGDPPPFRGAGRKDRRPGARHGASL